MALVKCWECGKEASDSAEYCPHCGVKSPAWRPEPRIDVVKGVTPSAGVAAPPKKGSRLFGCGVVAVVGFMVLYFVGLLVEDDTSERTAGSGGVRPTQVARVVAATTIPGPATATPGPTATEEPAPLPTPYFEPEIAISAEDLVGEWLANEVAADNMYVGRVIDVRGKIIDVQEKSAFLQDNVYEVTLDGGILAYVDCTFDLVHKESLLLLARGQIATVRGRVSRGSPAHVYLRKCVVPNDQ